MLRFLVLIFLFFSFESFSAYYTVTSSTDGEVPVGVTCIASRQNNPPCTDLLPPEYLGKLLINTGRGGGGTTVSLIGYYLRPDCGNCSSVAYYIYFDAILSCTSAEQCEPIAEKQCTQLSQTMINFNYVSPDVFTYECLEEITQSQECENTVIQQCISNGGFASSDFTDDGQGLTQCSGICGDGSIAGAEPEPDCSVYPFCDASIPPSDLDFGSGGSGSNVAPPSTTTADTEHEIDYEADGSMVDPTAPFSAIQGDKLINEVVKSRNDNTTNLLATTQATNQTIVEKSDDIQQTISNSANGIIDAVNNILPFHDGNIVQGMEQFSVKIDNLADIFGNLKEDFGELKNDLDTDLGSDYVHTTLNADFSGFDVLFSADSGIKLEELVKDLQLVIKTESFDFQASLNELVSIGSPSVGEYEQKSLDLGGWGTFDISLSRFTTLFGGLGNIIYFLAAMTAMTIVLGGIRL
ncbi:hypothetical protein [Colwellia sp. TT2012]|uniref:hypothetical protein n=1 Tax=Colwellia sp. TT2012 TaxID=1720342 RepID=UPI00070D0B2F|nr:hypothetical protein [Colwellia sp. TT2012]